MKNKWYKLWRCVIANIMYILAQQETKKKIDADVDRYLTNSSFNKRHSNRVLILDYLLLSWDKTFRNVFYYRFRVHNRLCALSKILLPEIEGIELDGEIEEGLYLSHNHLVAHPQKAGRNLRVGPGVVIGKNNGKYPIIGDNVYIAANSTVIGDINIGDNVIIGAGTVVTKSLPGNAVYVGNPAHFVKNIDEDAHLMGLITRID